MRGVFTPEPLVGGLYNPGLIVGVRGGVDYRGTIGVFLSAVTGMFNHQDRSIVKNMVWKYM